MPIYQKITGEILSELRKIVGSDHVFSGSDVPVEYAYDAGTKDGPSQSPEAVVFPASTGEVAEIVRLANRQLIPVTPRGGGSGLAGGAVPVNGGIVIDLRRMNRIIQINPAARYMVVEAAVRTLTIQQEARKHGLLYAGDPCSSDDCVIAGNVATNAGGNRAVKYGVTADQVYALEVVTPQGEIVTLGGRLKKNATGYGLVRLIIGSEGTLGIITQVTLKLQRLAPLLPNFLATFPNLSTAVNLVGILLDSEIDPISVELMDRQTVTDIERYQRENTFAGHESDCLIIQFEAQDPADLAKKQGRLKEICHSYGCISIEEAEGEKIWQARRIWGKAIQAGNPVGASEDIVVPVDELLTFIEKLQALVNEFHFEYRIAGHAGDGNMHLRILPGAVPLSDWEAQLVVFRQQLYRTAYLLGGRLSGEHGIGLKRKQFLRSVIQPCELELMKAVKKAFDPNLILNPGKIFDVDKDITTEMR
ncbi:MAG TPA: FAD-binding oxidoreductase [Methylomusa anaerophila]|uniref:Putative FAD-linked oxidoreductase n=1 Tax=Methylomusa anaerophila TaxID=1930071 RepID=A0A348AEV9_9FIRM|nr:FAD-binding oxidoreductase [Methylomusa anaerophila]BBB89607.1 putative FAD-linked oxidoreductase [Methylomusa anaerophila]HML89620.1 FAD-binding oxidoreductase [Methylomusa anaerophila]